MRKKQDRRLFFALWPDESVREQIEDRLRPVALKNCRPVPRRNWHMTLHFIGNTSLVERNCLHRQASEYRADGFDLCIDVWGYFMKPKVFWLGCQHPPQPLFDLQAGLGKKISRCQYRPESRPYAPHVTVARKVRIPPEPIMLQPIEWWVDRFVLVESVSVASGVRYDVIEEYLYD